MSRLRKNILHKWEGLALCAGNRISAIFRPPENHASQEHKDPPSRSQRLRVHPALLPIRLRFANQEHAQIARGGRERQKPRRSIIRLHVSPAFNRRPKARSQLSHGWHVELYAPEISNREAYETPILEVESCDQCSGCVLRVRFRG